MRTILEWVARASSIGTSGQPPRRAHQISLINQVALQSCAVPIPYQVFYLLHDASRYLPLVVVNAVFMACCIATLFMNRAGKHAAARNTMFTALHVQLLVVTYFLGNSAGVHLLYFPLGTWLGLFFASRRLHAILAFTLAALLFVVCHYAFPPEAASIAAPAALLHVTFIGSAVSALCIAGALSYQFRLEMDRVEAELQRSNEELARLSGQDPLTGLANRRTLDDRLTRECARLRRPGQHIAVLLCDVDHFKAYNDHYGHLAGDACLKRVAEALSSVARRANDVVARYGGEEFVIVLPATDCAGALRVAEEARARVSALGIPHERSDAAPVVTVSVGVACCDPATPLAPEDLLRRADAALYAAKRAGRNRVVRYDGLGPDGTATA